MPVPTPQAPYEVIAAPFTVYVAPVGEAFPTLDESPSGNWETLGTSGKQSITHDGVLVSHRNSYTSTPFVLPGATSPSRVARVSEDVVVTMVIADMTAVLYGRALNNATVAHVDAGAGTAGYSTVTLLNGPLAKEFALLIRGDVSPYIAAGVSQYELPRVTQTAPPMPLFVKKEPVGMAFSFRVIRDSTLGYGLLRLQDSAAT